MNRAQRRAIARRPAAAQCRLCTPGTHAFQELQAAVEGKVVAHRIVCTKCRRTIEQVLEESPGDLALYRSFLEAEAKSEPVPRSHDDMVRRTAGAVGSIEEHPVAANDAAEPPEEAADRA